MPKSGSNDANDAISRKKKNLCIQKGKQVGITREQNKVSRENSSEVLKRKQ